MTGYDRKNRARTTSLFEDARCAIESLEGRTLLSGIPVSVEVSSSNVYPTAGTFVLTAKITPAVQQGTSLPSGSIAFFDGTTVLGGGAVESNGIVNFDASLATLGSHTITAQYSGDTNYAPAASGPLIENVSASAALLPTLRGTLPVTVVAGEKTHIRQTLTLAIGKDLSFNGPVTGQLYLASGPRIDSTAVLLPETIAKKVKLKGNLRAALALNLTSLPATVPTGNYYLLTKLSDASGSIVVSSSSTAIGVQTPTRDLAGAFAKTPVTAKPGRKIPETLLVTNDGNIPIRGALQIDLEASPSPMPDANLLPAATKPINLQPGHSIRLSITAVISSIAGNYFLIGEIDPANTLSESTLANNTFISAQMVMVAD